MKGLRIIMLMLFLNSLLPTIVLELSGYHHGRTYFHVADWANMWISVIAVVAFFVIPAFLLFQLVKVLVISYELLTGTYVCRPDRPWLYKCTPWVCHCHDYAQLKSQDDLVMRTTRDLRTGAGFSAGRYK